LNSLAKQSHGNKTSGSEKTKPIVCEEGAKETTKAFVVNKPVYQ